MRESTNRGTWEIPRWNGAREFFFEHASVRVSRIGSADTIHTRETCLICTCALQYINSRVFRAHASASRKTSRATANIPTCPGKHQVPEKNISTHTHPGITIRHWFIISIIALMNKTRDQRAYRKQEGQESRLTRMEVLRLTGRTKRAGEISQSVAAFTAWARGFISP